MNDISLAVSQRFIEKPGDQARAEKLFAQGAKTWPPAFSQHSITAPELEKCKQWPDQVGDKEALLIVGMGGSSLGAKALQEFLGFPGTSNRKVYYLEGTHPRYLAQLRAELETKKVALLFISKSGTTLESRSQLAFVRANFKEVEEYFVTSNEEKIADLQPKPERVYKIPAELGGRFSIVSPVGVLPGLFMGADMGSFMQGFNEGLKDYGLDGPIASNVAKQYALYLYQLFNSTCDGIVLWIYDHSLTAWGDWLVQLWGESIGKNENTCALPYLCTGPEDQHSLLQFFLEGPNRYAHSFIYNLDYGAADIKLGQNVAGDFNNKTLSEILTAQKQSIAVALDESKRPVCEFALKGNDVTTLGKWMSFWMFVTAYAGYLYEVNPFDQPAVEKGKIYCKKLLAGEKVSSPFTETFKL